MPCNDSCGCVDQDRIEKSELKNARGDLPDLFFGMGSRVLIVRYQLVNWPQIDARGHAAREIKHSYSVRFCEKNRRGKIPRAVMVVTVSGL